MADPTDRRNAAAGWVVIADEPDQMSAEITLEYLRRQAIPARLAPGDTIAFLGISHLPTRVLVPAAWAAEARLALARRGQDEPLAPGLPP